MRTFLLVLLVGCVESPLVPCGEISCPSGYVCTVGGCATPADVAACDGLGDGEACHASNGGAGTCQGGACHTGLCGNLEIDIGEACDDGNLISGDGCRGDCGKVEMCGDAELDTGEACDDGNPNPADGCDACALTVWTATTAVGTAVGATTTALADPRTVAIDGIGRVYIADTDNHRVRRIELDGSITTIAGTGTPDFAGDGGPATSAMLAQPSGIAVDGVGRVFVADTGNHRIRLIETDGTIATIAGTDSAGFNGDGPAIYAKLDGPHGLAIDGLGRLFIADTNNNRVRRLDIDGNLVTIAGTDSAGFSGDNGPAVAAQLAGPTGVAIDALGRTLVADTDNNRIRSIEADGTIVTIAGLGTRGSSGDGGLATAAELAAPASIAIDALGRVVVADTGNQRVRRFTRGGTIATVAGTGSSGFGGDGGTATAALFDGPAGVAVDANGIVIADAFNQRIRRVDPAGTITTIAGNGAFGFGGDGRQATSAQLQSPYSVAIDGSDRLYIADTFNHRVRRVEPDGTIVTVAGSGLPGFSGDGGAATAAQLEKPDYIALDAQGRLYIADTYNHRVRRVETNGVIATIAGTGTAGFSGDDGAATNAQLSNPNGLAVSAAGIVYIADTYNNRIRKLENGTITTIAGTGAIGYNGDGAAATASTLNYPYAIALDGTGRVVIADTGNHRVRRIELDGTISTIAGNGVLGSSGDGGPATSAQLNGPYGITFDGSGRLVIADAYNSRIRRVETNGTITTIAGSATSGPSGDAGPATQAEVAFPLGVAVDSLGRVVIADTNNQRIRRVDTTIRTVAGKIDPENIGPVAEARLDDPRAIAIGPAFTLVAGGASGTLEAIRGGRVEVVAGRYPQNVATGALARFRTIGFGDVGGVAIDPTTGLIYVSETSANRLHVITQVDPTDPSTWTIASLANASGTPGFVEGAAATARFRAPTGLYLDTAAHTLYVADTGNHAIRALDLTANTVRTVVNTSHNLGYNGDGGPATAALLYRPTALTRCANGDLFIADTGNNRVRRVVMDGTISTVLGDGVAASSGEGLPAHTFPVDGPRGLACDPIGNLFVSSTTTVRLLTAQNGIVDGNGPVSTIYGAPPRTTFPSSITSCLTGLAAIGSSTIEVADACTGLLVRLDRAAM